MLQGSCATGSLKDQFAERLASSRTTHFIILAVPVFVAKPPEECLPACPGPPVPPAGGVQAGRHILWMLTSAVAGGPAAAPQGSGMCSPPRWPAREAPLDELHLQPKMASDTLLRRRKIAVKRFASRSRCTTSPMNPAQADSSGEGRGEVLPSAAWRPYEREGRLAGHDWHIVGEAAGGRGHRFLLADRLRAERALHLRVVTETTARLCRSAAARALQKAWRRAARDRATRAQARSLARSVCAAACSGVVDSVAPAGAGARPGRSSGRSSEGEADDQVLDRAIAEANLQRQSLEVLLAPAGAVLRRLRQPCRCGASQKPLIGTPSTACAYCNRIADAKLVFQCTKKKCRRIACGPCAGPLLLAAMKQEIPQGCEDILMQSLSYQMHGSPAAPLDNG